jgi:Origin recognition complex winged helix C-terminal
VSIVHFPFQVLPCLADTPISRTSFVDPSDMLPLADKFQLGLDAVEHARTVLCSTPRQNLQLALEAPEIIFASQLGSDLEGRGTELEIAAELRVVPDLSRAYGLWRERGSARLMNLADWYSVFKMTSVNSTKSGPDAEEQAGQEAQARFAGSLFQLATMGLIRSTKRKADHVAKTVFDLPVVMDPLAE